MLCALEAKIEVSVRSCFVFPLWKSFASIWPQMAGQWQFGVAGGRQIGYYHTADPISSQYYALAKLLLAPWVQGERVGEGRLGMRGSEGELKLRI